MKARRNFFNANAFLFCSSVLVTCSFGEKRRRIHYSRVATCRLVRIPQVRIPNVEEIQISQNLRKREESLSNFTLTFWLLKSEFTKLRAKPTIMNMSMMIGSSIPKSFLSFERCRRHAMSTSIENPKKKTPKHPTMNFQAEFSFQGPKNKITH